MVSEENILADARYSVSVPANSSAAVAFAVSEQNLTRVLVEPMTSPAGQGNEAGVFFGPLYCEEMTALRETPMMDWLAEYYQKYDLPRVDSLDDLLSVEGLDELWLWQKEGPRQAGELADILQKHYSNESRLVIAAPFALPKQISFRCADPTRKRNFFLCNGTLEESLRHPMRWRQSVALRSDGLSAIRTRTIL